MKKKVSLGSKRSAIKAANLAVDIKSHDVVVLDVKKVTNITDYFVICSGDSDTHTRAIAGKIKDGLEEHGIKLLHHEGEDFGLWILLDYGDFIIHIFENESRQYYDLERLWGDAVIIKGQLPVFNNTL